MAYKVALLCLLLTLGCSSMASARSLKQTYSYPVDGTSCHIYKHCGWSQPPGCIDDKTPDIHTTVDVFVNAVVNVILVGKIEALAAVVALLNLVIAIDVALCASVIIALIVNVTVGVKVCAHALVQLCALVSGEIIAQLCIALKVEVLIKLCLALGTGDCIKLLVPLFALIQLNVEGYLTVLVALCNGLYALATVWANVFANVCLEIGVTICGPLLQGLNSTCLNAVLAAIKVLPGGTAYVCACNTLLGINILGLLVVCIG